MADQFVRVGPIEDAFIYDDADYDSGIETTAPIKCASAATDPDHLVRLAESSADLTTINARLDAIEAELADHESRISALEAA